MIPYFVVEHNKEGESALVFNDCCDYVDDVKFNIAEILFTKSRGCMYLYYTTEMVKKLYDNNFELNDGGVVIYPIFKYGYWYNNEWVNNISYEDLSRYFNIIMFNFINNKNNFDYNIIVNTLEEAQSGKTYYEDSIKLSNWKDTYEINYTEVFDEIYPKVIDVKKRV